MVRKPRIVLALVLLAAVVVSDAWLAHGRIGHWLADHTGPVLNPAVATIGVVRAWGHVVLSRSDLASENLRLQADVERLRAEAGAIDALHNELAFTRAAAGIRERLTADPIAAGIFSWYRAGAATAATINRGETDGIVVGDVVITAGGSFIGSVRDVYMNHATVTVLGDPTLRIAARIMGTNISGLLRTGEDGLILDFVQKDEPVTEGDVVLTSGNDRFPPGIVIGTIRSVDASQSALFAIVRVDPMITQPLATSVLVLHP